MNSVNTQAQTAGTPWADCASPGHRLTEKLQARMVDEIECGLIVCDEQGVVQFANHSARQELLAGHALHLTGERLGCVGPARAELGNAIRWAALKGRRQLVKLCAAGDRLLVSVMPIQPDDYGPCFALLVLGRRRLCSELGLELLAKVYSLTLAERRVLAALMAESSPREIADANGVALSTVRSQISSIRDKLGARSIDSLLIRAGEMPPVVSALPRAALASMPVPAPRREQPAWALAA